MDGFPNSRRPEAEMAGERPDADPLIARVGLVRLFAWLAEGEAVVPPVLVFEAGTGGGSGMEKATRVVPPPPPSARKPRQPAPQAPERAVPEPYLAASPDAPPFLPPPLIAPVLRPRPALSRADDFLPARAVAES
jgi:hypothetical protein